MFPQSMRPSPQSNTSGGCDLVVHFQHCSALSAAHSAPRHPILAGDSEDMHHIIKQLLLVRYYAHVWWPASTGVRARSFQ